MIKPTLLFSLAMLSACSSSPLSPDNQTLVGITHFHSEPAVADAPDVAVVGVPFEIRIRTYGGGCYSVGPTEVRVNGLSAMVTPYDHHSGGPICTHNLQMFDHRASVTINAAGSATIVFRGIEIPGELTALISRTVEVRRAGANSP